MHISTIVIFGYVFAAIQYVVFRRAKSALVANAEGWLAEAKPSVRGRRAAERLARLDASLVYEPWRLGLKRLGVAAPMFGIVITAVGFMMATGGGTVPNETLFLERLRPLYAGVLLGGVLALFNQILLAFLDHRLNAVRTSCEARLRASGQDDDSTDVLIEFEETIRSITAATQSRVSQVASDAASQVNGLIQSSSGVAKQLDQMVDDYVKSRGQITAAATELLQAAQNMTRQIGDSVKAVTGSLTREAGALSTTLSTGGASIDAASKSFAQPVERLIRAVSSMEERIQTLTLSSQQFQAASTDAMAAAGQVGETLLKTLNPALDVTTKALETAARECEDGSKALKIAGESLDGSARVMGSGSRDLQASAGALSKELPEFNKALGSLTTGLTRHETLLTRTSTEIVALLRSLGEEMAKSVNQHADGVGRHLRKEIETTLQEASTTMLGASRACGQSTEALAKVVQALGQCARSMNSGTAQLTVATDRLNGTLHGLEQSLQRNLIQRLFGLGR